MLHALEPCSWEALLSGRPSANKLMVFSFAPSQTRPCAPLRSAGGGNNLTGGLCVIAARPATAVPPPPARYSSHARLRDASLAHMGGTRKQTQCVLARRTLGDAPSELAVSLPQQGRGKKEEKAVRDYAFNYRQPFQVNLRVRDKHTAEVRNMTSH